MSEIIKSGSLLVGGELPQDEYGWCPISWRVEDGHVIQWCNLACWEQIKSKDVYKLRADRWQSEKRRIAE